MFILSYYILLLMRWSETEEELEAEIIPIFHIS